jgi:hypothetical protein
MGCQRGERKKCINIFPKTDILFYFVALSDYNKLEYSDDVTPRFNESLGFFKELINNEYFKKSTVVLILNKLDIYTRKINKTPLNHYYFQNEVQFIDIEKNRGIELIKNMFLRENQNKNRKIIVEILNSVDISNNQFDYKLIINKILDKIIKLENDKLNNILKLKDNGVELGIFILN